MESVALACEDDRVSDVAGDAATVRSWPLAARTRALMRQFGLRAVKSRGQNFLIEEHVALGLAEAVCAGEANRIVEVGAGLGALTLPLAETGRRVVAYEIDRKLSAALQWLLAGLDNAEVRTEDFLKADLEKLRAGEAGERSLSPVWAAVGNLPYYITTPLLEKLFGAAPRAGLAEDGGEKKATPRTFERVVATMQAEVAERILARPGSKQYGPLTIFCRFHCETIERLFRIGPGAFLPRPEVDSVALLMVPRERQPEQIRDAEVFFTVVRAAFGHRRKTLGTALRTGLRGSTDSYPPAPLPGREGGTETATSPPAPLRKRRGEKGSDGRRDTCPTRSVRGGVEAAIRDALARASIDPERRAETLSFDEFAALSNAFGEVTGLFNVSV